MTAAKTMVMLKGWMVKSGSCPEGPTCDVCLRGLTRWCVSLVIGATAVVEMRGVPEQDRPGCVVVRYHADCYPRRLAEWLNKGYGHKFTMAEVAVAP